MICPLSIWGSDLRIRGFYSGSVPGFVEKGLRPLQPVCSGAFPGFVEKGLRPLQPVCSGSFPPASPPCHHYGQGCRSFLPKICAPRYARVGTKGIYGGTAHNFGTENLRPRYRMVARKFSCKIS